MLSSSSSITHTRLDLNSNFRSLNLPTSHSLTPPKSISPTQPTNQNNQPSICNSSSSPSWLSPLLPLLKCKHILQDESLALLINFQDRDRDRLHLCGHLECRVLPSCRRCYHRHTRCFYWYVLSLKASLKQLPSSHCNHTDQIQV